MSSEEEISLSNPKLFNPKKSIERARSGTRKQANWKIDIPEGEFVWSTTMDKVDLIRKGLPYNSIEFISKRANLPVKNILTLLGIPQTTYNKKKRDNGLLGRRDSEIILILTELLDFGLEVFNNEKEKFLRWLRKPNVSLNGAAPDNLFDSFTGIQEVKNCLNRLEYGNLA